jgi:hypothetical protein
MKKTEQKKKELKKIEKSEEDDGFYLEKRTGKLQKTFQKCSKAALLGRGATCMLCDSQVYPMTLVAESAF